MFKKGKGSKNLADDESDNDKKKMSKAEKILNSPLKGRKGVAL